jgi:cytochrome b
MRQALVYDWPTRIFHWLFAGLFLAAFLIGKNVDDESPIFSIHMLLGLSLGFLTVLRLVWGFIGSRHARFSGFELRPAQLASYIKGVISGTSERWAGHNPASSWAALSMIGLGLGLAVSGYMMATGWKEELEDIHELLANGFILVVALHVAGVIFHTLRHKDGIGFSMLNGKKTGVRDGESISSAHGWAGVALTLAMLVFGSYLYKGYNSQMQTLQFFGQSLELGESEEDENHDADSGTPGAESHGDEDESDD